jgi:hypothetical protein
MRLVQHDHRILADIWVNKAFSLEHAVRHVLDPRLWARAIFETDCIANLLTETTADLLRNTFCNGHSGDATGLCAANSTIVCKAIFSKVLRHLSCLPGSRVPDNDEDLVLSQTVSKLVEENRGWTYISDCLE